MNDPFANPFAKVRQLHPDNPGDRALIVRFARHLEPDPADAEDVALGIVESIRDGAMTLRIDDDLVIMRTADGDGVTIALSDLP